MFKAFQYKPWLIRTVPPYTILFYVSHRLGFYTGARFCDPNHKLVSDVIFLTRNKTAHLHKNVNVTRKLFQFATFLKIYGEMKIFAK